MFKICFLLGLLSLCVWGSSNDTDVCPTGEAWCSSLDETERLALEAIRSLHRQLDDDQNGNIDLAESDEFLREELKYEKNIENRQRAFHRNDDTQVSVRELWETWRKSEVHNWTIEQTVEWLGTVVGLPQHEDKFLSKGINGTVLPILAVNHNNFLQANLGVKDAITRQRIAVKAMDVVLFGPPRDTTNRIKDVILTTLLALAVIACYLVYKRYQWAQEDLTKMSKHMAELSKAEETLLDLQRELEKARTDQQLREKEAVVERNSGVEGDDPEEVAKLREENMILRSELHRAEAELQDKCWVSPPALQHWLQYTYELELKTYNKKKTGAERQLKQAKDACDKLKKKRSSLMGAFVTTHGRSIDDVDKAILEARTALTEITHELQERMHRWKQVEVLVGCPVMNNPGIQHLESLLKVYGKPHSFASGPGSVISNSQDDFDDDASSIYCPSAALNHISSPAYLMCPGHPSPSFYPSASARVFNFQQSPPDYSTTANVSPFGVVSSVGALLEICNLTSQSEISARENGPGPCSPSRPGVTADLMVINDYAVSGPTSHQVQLSMARSKSASSMLSLRDRDRGMSRESSSKESSTAEDEVIGEASDITNSRRVTFRTDHRSKMRAFSNGRANGPLFDSMDNEEARRVVSKALSQTNSLDSLTKSEELTQEENKEMVKLTLSLCGQVITENNEEKKSQVPVTTNISGGDASPNFKTNMAATGIPTIAQFSHATLHRNPKGKGKLWNRISRFVGNGTKADGDKPETKESDKKDKYFAHDSNGVLGVNNGLRNSVASIGTIGSKKSRRISGLFSSLRRYSDKTADIRKYPAETDQRIS